MNTNKLVGVVILLLTLSACGQATSTVTSDNTAGSLAVMPQSVQPFYNQYFRLIGSNKQIAGNISLVDLSAMPAIATCNASGQSYAIQIDSAYWGSATDDQKRTAVFHELTHCVFNEMGHSPSVDNSYMVELSNTAFDEQLLETEAPALAQQLTVGGVPQNGIIVDGQVVN